MDIRSELLQKSTSLPLRSNALMFVCLYAAEEPEGSLDRVALLRKGGEGNVLLAATYR